MVIQVVGGDAQHSPAPSPHPSWALDDVWQSSLALTDPSLFARYSCQQQCQLFPHEYQCISPAWSVSAQQHCACPQAVAAGTRGGDSRLAVVSATFPCPEPTAGLFPSSHLHASPRAASGLEPCPHNLHVQPSGALRCAGPVLHSVLKGK